MNSLVVEKVVYRFQDLVTQKKIKTFTKFLCEVFCHFEMSNVNRISHNFIYEELKNIHTFLKIIQHYPNSHLLAHALKPLFKMLLDNLIIPKIVFVGDREYFNIIEIRYSDLILAARRKRIIQIQNDTFVIPYKGKPPTRPLRKAEDLFLKKWVFTFVAKRIFDKVQFSLEKYGENLLNPDGAWSGKQKLEFGKRMAVDYLNSDSKYLPREMFDFPLDVPDVPEAH